MTSAERRAVSGLAGIFGLRMFGLFMVLPVLSIYATKLPGQTPLLVGVALGIYGLTQAMFQIPYGLWSDKWGRKPVITVGLIVFAVGSLVAAGGEHILTVIVGRALQGAGAVAAAIMALTADLTREEQRTKAMAFIGVSVGAAFMAALIAAPLLQHWIGVSGIFWLTAGLALLAILVLWVWIPSPARSTPHRDVETVPEQLVSIVGDSHLLRLNIGIFVLHMVLTAMFVVIPFILVDNAGFPVAEHWKVYVPVVLAAAVAMIPFVIMSAKTRRVPKIMTTAISILLISQISLIFDHATMIGIVVSLWVFFWGFNTLEALLPSLVSRVSPAAGKGTAIGVYNSFQFIGVFIGGLAGGWLLDGYGYSGVFTFCALSVVVWLVVIVAAPAPKLLNSRILRVSSSSSDLARELAEVRGVQEAVLVAEEGVAYLKVDEQQLDEERLRQFGR